MIEKNLVNLPGAAVPDAERTDDLAAVMDIVQEFILRPDSFMKALGVRAKRDTSMDTDTDTDTDTSPAGFTVF